MARDPARSWVPSLTPVFNDLPVGGVAANIRPRVALIDLLVIKPQSGAVQLTAPEPCQEILAWLNDMPNSTELDLRTFIRDIPDFPKPGILFRDITPLLASPAAFREAIHRLCNPFRDQGIDVVVGAEARGFIFAPPMAMEMNAGFVPVRKPGKLPGETHCFHYELEYGEDSLELHVDDIKPGQRVLVVDDLLATGGTVDACCQLIEKTGAKVVACAFLIELKALGGAARIAPHEVFALLDY